MTKVVRRTMLLALAGLAAAGASAATAPAAKGDSAKGRAVYVQWCAACHDRGPGHPGTQSLEVKYRGTDVPAAIEDRRDLSPQVTALFVRRGFALKPVLFLLFLNSQWLHIFWITDEFVVASNQNANTGSLPAWLAYVAILIDYLELPVMYDTLKR